ncbi:MFS transporter [Sulfuracidifex metallicus]|jgi:MFS family permease|uniref:MFS transporter n=1 Tax=Sulfuracidifex metallicus DSM 6482 = JCM 9184 TaxID=523847 RepID=A0A6A9QQJ0_SULME|nr:MFS transporter [Sulfuracidifex metallicus]MUN29555.1 MFS transporter [Sulfuracidifex metallicus DSM 6482 = JCM 9184]WOE49934.1 MFS transporter [Sulfuracidifex metallicus DSM 6482 = JCM 9184]
MDKKSGNKEEKAKELIARLNRLSSWPLPTSFILIIGVGYFFTFYDISDIGFAMPAIDQQFHLGSSLSLFIALSVGLIGYAIGSYVVGTISDYYGRFRAMILTMGLTALGSFGDAASFNVPELAIFRFITGLGLGADLNLVSTYLSELSPPNIRGKITVYSFILGILGQAITPFIALSLVPVYYDGWRYLFAIGGIIAVVALALRFELPESPRWLISRAGNLEKAEEIITRMENTVRDKMGKLNSPNIVNVDVNEKRFPTSYVFKKPYVYRLALLVTMWFFWYIGNYGFLGDATTLLSASGISISSSIGYLAVGAIGYPVGAILMALTADRFERKYVIFMDTVVWLIGMLTFSTRIPSLIYVGSFLASLALGMYLQVAYTYTAENYPTRARTSGFALTDGIGHIGGALGALFLPVLVSTYGFSFGFTFIGITGVIAGVLALLGPKASKIALEEVSA